MGRWGASRNSRQVFQTHRRRPSQKATLSNPSHTLTLHYTLSFCYFSALYSHIKPAATHPPSGPDSSSHHATVILPVTHLFTLGKLSTSPTNWYSTAFFFSPFFFLFCRAIKVTLIRLLSLIHGILYSSDIEISFFPKKYEFRKKIDDNYSSTLVYPLPIHIHSQTERIVPPIRSQSELFTSRVNIRCGCVHRFHFWCVCTVFLFFNSRVVI